MRELLPINDDDFEKLPKELVGVPVFINYKNGCFRVWPRPQEDDEGNIRYQVFGTSP